MLFYPAMLSAIVLTSTLGGTICSIASLQEIPLDQPEGTLFFFDIDDTLIDFPHMVGSKAWRRYIAEATQTYKSTHSWHDVFSYALALAYPLQLIEEQTKDLIRHLQNSGYVICALTARERNLWYDMPQQGVDLLTIAQLRSLGIDFQSQCLEQSYPDLSLAPEYFAGVFFANIEPKGGYLFHLLERAPHLPPKIVFIDDKRKQVDSVASALESLHIPYECYIYTATEPKAARFDPLIAGIQLHAFYISSGQTILSDSEAAAIAQEFPERNADYYLRALIGSP